MAIGEWVIMEMIGWCWVNCVCGFVELLLYVVLEQLSMDWVIHRCPSLFDTIG